MPDKRLNQAELLYQQGELTKALSLYQDILADDPDNPDILHILAIIHARLGNDADALDHINAAIKFKPNDYQLYNSLGNIYVRLADDANAIQAYKKVIRLNPHYAIAYNNLANRLRAENKRVAAEKAYFKAITLDENYTEAYYNYALLLLDTGNQKNAKQQLEKLIQIAPNHVNGLNKLAEIFIHEGDAETAKQHLQTALENNPHHVEANHNLGLAFFKLADYDNAIGAFEKTIMLNPKHPEANHNLANAYLENHDNNTALNYYFRQIEINPLFESYYNIGVLLMYQERNRDAAQYLEHAAKLEPNDINTHTNLGALYLKLKDYDNAITHYEIAKTLKPDDHEIQHILTAISQTANPEQAPNVYTQHLFDQYAPYYDKHLTQFLHYDVPSQIEKIVFNALGLTTPELTILDLGCGTGLCGEQLKPIAKKLIGVDLSPEMLATAEQKGIYDELIEDDLVHALQPFHDIDLIVAADVFTYLGDLTDIFQQVHRALKSGGCFVFTVERNLNDNDFQLQQTIRYAHQKAYLERLIHENHFDTLEFETVTLRQQKKQPIQGYLVLLRK